MEGTERAKKEIALQAKQKRIGFRSAETQQYYSLMTHFHFHLVEEGLARLAVVDQEMKNKSEP